LRETHGNHCRRADDRAGRQVDAAGDDHLRDADGDDADRRHLQNDDRKPLRVDEKALTLKEPAKSLEDNGNSDQTYQGIQFVRQRPRRLDDGGFRRPHRRGFCILRHRRPSRNRPDGRTIPNASQRPGPQRLNEGGARSPPSLAYVSYE
jgi:hypothetical protein